MLNSNGTSTRIPTDSNLETCRVSSSRRHLINIFNIGSLLRSFAQDIEEIDGKIAAQCRIIDDYDNLLNRLNKEQLPITGEPGSVATGDLEELREKVRRFELTLLFREEAIKSLQAANSALVDQLKSRITTFQALLTGLFTIATILGTALFIYSGFSQQHLNQMSEESKNTLTLLRDSSVSLDRQFGFQAAILAKLANAAGKLNRGFQYTKDERWEMAYKQALAAQNEMDTAAETLDNALKDKAAVTSDKVTDLVSPLRTAVKEHLYAAYELRALSYYSLHSDPATAARQQISDLGVVAKLMLAADRNRWQGHHYMGLYYDMVNQKTDALDEFKEAVILDKEGLKIDALNLAEVYFTSQEFNVSSEYVSAYFNSNQFPAMEDRIIARLYGELSDFMIDGNAFHLAKFDQTLGNSVKFRRNFDATNLREFEKKLGDGYDPKEKEYHTRYHVSISEYKRRGNVARRYIEKTLIRGDYREGA